MMAMNMIITGLLLILVVFFICLIFKIKSKIPVAIALLFIAFSAILLALGDVDFANDIATVGYFLLVASVVLVIVENIRDIRQEQSPEDEKGK